MPSIRSLLFAKRVIHDSNTNRVSVIDLIENIEIISFPATIPDCAILAVLEKKKGERAKKYSIKFVMTYNGQTTTPSYIDVDFKAAEINNTILNVPFIILEKPGILSIEVLQNEVVLETTLISVTQRKN